MVRLGVTGLSRSGKTVFITGLVANLLQHGRMPQLRAAAQGRIEAVYLQPQPDLTLPRFAYEDHLAAMTGDDPQWPAVDPGDHANCACRSGCVLRAFWPGWRVRVCCISTSSIIRASGCWTLAFLDKTYAEWSEATLDRIAKRPEAADFMARARAEDGALRLDEGRAQDAGRRLHRLSDGGAGGRAGPTARRGGSCCRAIWPGRRS